MNASLEWDPQFSAHVPLWISNLTGQTVRYLNPFNFTNVTVGNISVAGAPPALYAFSNAVQCVYPLSGVYYFLNRLLFYQEVFFGLSALALGYEWLSTIIIAAALNYSASAAVHAFTLCLNPSYRHSETDYIVVFYILSLSILLANPLLQWSRTIRRKDRVDIRLVVSLWAAFVWVGAMVDIPFLFNAQRPFASVQLSSGCGFPQAEPVQLFGNGITGNDAVPVWRNDTVNVMDRTYTPLVQTLSGQCHYSVGSCHAPSLSWDSSPLRQGQQVVPLVTFSKSYNSTPLVQLTTALDGFFFMSGAVMLSAILFHRYMKLDYVRARMYESLRGNLSQRWRRPFAFAASLAYYATHQFITIMSIPIAMTYVGIQEAILWQFPSSEPSSTVGQWSPWSGVGLLLFAVMISRDPIPQFLHDFVLWATFAPFRRVFPRQIKNRSLPTAELNINILTRLRAIKKHYRKRLASEYGSLRQWILRPDQESRKCIEAETSVANSKTG